MQENLVALLDDGTHRDLPAVAELLLPSAAAVVLTQRAPERLIHEPVVDQRPDRTGELAEQDRMQTLVTIMFHQDGDEAPDLDQFPFLEAELVRVGGVERDPEEDEGCVRVAGLPFRPRQPS